MLQVNLVPVHTIYIRTHIVLGTSWYQPGTSLQYSSYGWNFSLVITAHTATTIHENAKRLWTRAEVDGGANNGPPQTPTLGDGPGQRSMDTHGGSNNNFII